MHIFCKPNHAQDAFIYDVTTSERTIAAPYEKENNKLHVLACNWDVAMVHSQMIFYFVPFWPMKRPKFGTDSFFSLALQCL